MPMPMHHIAITNNVWLGLTGNTIFQLDTIPFTTIEHNTAINPRYRIRVRHQGVGARRS